MSRPLLNVVVRSAALFTKLVTVMYLARALSVADLARFGIFSATVVFLLYLLGAELYAHTVRELITTEKQSQGGVVRRHFSTLMLILVTSLPLILLVISLSSFRSLPVWWLSLVLLAEHLGQEQVRVLTALGKPVTASLAHFLRTAAWGPVLIVCFTSKILSPALTTVYSFWAASAWLSVLFSCGCLFRLRLGGWRSSAEHGWARVAIRGSFLLFIATLATRALFTLDRYFVEYFQGYEATAAYTLFATFAGGVIGVADAAFNAYQYPRLVRAAADCAWDRFRSVLLGLFTGVTLFTLASTIVLMVAVPPILSFLGLDSYASRTYLLPWVLMSLSLYCFSTVAHLGLFALRKDREILLASLSSLLVFVVATVAWRNEAAGVPMALAVAFGVILVLKSVALARATPQLLKSSTAV